MNQKVKQKATSSVERDFYKVLNNSNFGIDCRNNINSYILEPLLGEISFIKKFSTIFGNETYRDFFSLLVMKEEGFYECNTKLLSSNKNDPAYQARKE